MPSSAPESLIRFSLEFDARFAELLTPRSDTPSRLAEAVLYAALAPGKRLRPFLVVECCRLCGGAADHAWGPAAAVECIHAFSLVHDDLPAMDDDDVRRGRPTVHRQFDEATAILSGDALVPIAFELLTRDGLAPDRGLRLVRELADATGWRGMIGGQALDLEGETSGPSAELVNSIHEKKTAALIAASCRMGALVAGAAKGDVDRLGRFGRNLGLAFQMVDDLLDLTAEQATTGKRMGKDASAGKQTYPRCVGVEESRALVQTRVNAALDELAPFGDRAAGLRELVEFVVSRNY